MSTVLLLLVLFKSLHGLGGCWYIICVILGDEVVEFAVDEPEDTIFGSPKATCLRLWGVWLPSILPRFVETTLWKAEFFPLPILVVTGVIPFGGGARIVLSILVDAVDAKVFEG